MCVLDILCVFRQTWALIVLLFGITSLEVDWLEKIRAPLSIEKKRS